MSYTHDPDHDHLLRDCASSTRRDIVQQSLDSLSRQKRELEAEKALHEALLRLSWICAACGWSLFVLKAAGAF